MSVLQRIFSPKRVAPGPVLEFHPSNELEDALLHTQAHLMSLRDFLVHHLLSSRVTLLLNQEPPEFSPWGKDVAPLLLASPRHGQVLAVFTDPERARPMSEASRQHKHAVETNFSRVLRVAAPGVGLIINPGWPVGLEVDAGRVAELKAV